MYTTTNTVTVSSTENQVDVTQSTSQVDISVGTIVGVNQTRYRYLGSEFSGSNGAANRALVSASVVFGSSAIIAVGFRLLDPASEYVISTTSATNDTLTITGMLFNDDVVLVWT